MFTHDQLQPYIDQKLISEGVHPDAESVMIYNYTQKCQFDSAWDEVTMQCRGLIMDWNKGEVLALPFPKFFNYGEREVQLPVEQHHVYEKYDGSLGILYWVNGLPYIATRGSFTSEQAQWATSFFRKYAERNEYHLQNTYLFEILYPSNRIVVDYAGREGLVLLAVRDRFTGKYHDIHTEVAGLTYIDKAVRHDSKSIDDLIKTERLNAEGFVVHYPEADLRLKIKHTEYKRLHKLITGVNAKAIWELLRDGKTLDELLDNVPDEFFKWVEDTAGDLTRQYNNILNEASGKHVGIHLMLTRKDQALALSDFAHRDVVFAMLDGKDYSSIIWKKLKPQATQPFKQDE